MNLFIPSLYREHFNISSVIHISLFSWTFALLSTVFGCPYKYQVLQAAYLQTFLFHPPELRVGIQPFMVSR